MLNQLPTVLLAKQAAEFAAIRFNALSQWHIVPSDHYHPPHCYSTEVFTFTIMYVHSIFVTIYAFTFFRNVKNTSAMFANTVKNKICVVDSVKLFNVLIILCNTVQTYTMYTKITVRFLFLSAYNLFASRTCTLFLSHDYSLFCLQTFCKQYTYSLLLHNDDLQTHNLS